MFYFAHISHRQWDLFEAFCSYDEAMECHSFKDILVHVKNDLTVLANRESVLQRKSQSLLKDVEKLLELKCHQEDATPQDTQPGTPEPKDVPENITSSIPNQSPEVKATSTDKETTIYHFNYNNRINKLSDTLINRGQLNVNSVTTGPSTSRKRREFDDLTNSSTSVSSDKSSGPDSQVEFMVQEGSHKYCMARPDHQPDVPHKPKLRKLQLEALKKLFYFGTSFSCESPLSGAMYKECQNEQHEKRSLRASGLLEHVAKLLEDEPFDTFVTTVWSSKPDGKLTGRTSALLDIVRYTLSSFHLVHRNMSSISHNHERTAFVENIVPSLLSLAKITGFVEFKWCESEFISTKCLKLKEHDYDLRSAPASKYIDALGFLTTHNNMELVIVEASSGKLKEHTTHTIEDSLKILECGVAALRKEASQYKAASLDTFKKLKVFGIQVIKNRVTLSEMSLWDNQSWLVIEKRSATLPSSWLDSILLVEYLELLATLFDGLCESQLVQKQLVKENLGLGKSVGPSVGSMFDE